MDPAARKILDEFADENKACVDCGAPRPQWASLSFAVLLCLQCAGTHRGFGVHVSFVRSITMDTWHDEQLRRIKLGGNAPFAAFLRDYPPEQSGYVESMSTHDKYHCWAATQYREKLTAALEDKPWSPSPPPAAADTPEQPSTAQSLRKARASTRSPSQPPSMPANESFFAALGSTNAARPDHLPPSQGGRYTGFGSTPVTPPPEHLSSAAAPTLGELQSDPARALSKGWSLFAAAVADASRTVSENVVKPGMERVVDPELREKVGGYVTSAGKRAAAAAESANTWGRAQFGVDVGAVVDRVRSGVAGGAPGAGYEAVQGSTSDDDDDDDAASIVGEGRGGVPRTEEWDEWKDF